MCPRSLWNEHDPALHRFNPKEGHIDGSLFERTEGLSIGKVGRRG